MKSIKTNKVHFLIYSVFTAFLSTECESNRVTFVEDTSDGEIEAENTQEEIPPCEPFLPPETGGEGADISQPISPGHAIAGKIKDSTQIPPGIKSWVEVGDILIRNSKVGFVIENTAGKEGFRSDGYNPFGGEIVNADLWNGDTPAGKSLMGEIFYGLGIQLVDPSSVSVTNDGADGNPAIVRVTGTLRPMPLLDLAAGSLLNPRPFNGDLIIDYVLDGDDEAININYTLRNPNTSINRLMLPIVGTIMGDGLSIFTPEGGFDKNAFTGEHDFYGFVGKEISYAIIDGRGGKLNYTLEESGVLAALLSRFIEIPACGETQITALKILVSEGGAEKLKKAFRRVTSIEEPPQLHGRVTVGGSEPAGYARVHIQKSDGTYVTTDITDEDGNYSAGLLPGDYTLTIVHDGHTIPEPISVTFGSDDQNLDIDIQPAGTLNYSIIDENNNPLPAKLIIFPQVERPSLPPSFGERTYPGGAYSYIFEIDGSGETILPPGFYRIFASHGYFYEVDEKTVEIKSGETSAVQLVLRKSVNTTGFMCADFHQHSMWSPDSWTLPETVVAANMAEGLEILVSTDHDWIADFQPTVQQLGVENKIKAFPGEEITSYQYGHFNPFPLTPDPHKRNNGAIEHYYRPPAEVFAEALSDPRHPILQVNHPRSGGMGDYFNYVQLDPVTCQPMTEEHPEWWSELWNMVEIFNSSDFRSNESDESTPRTVEDWFGLLNCGKRFTATGNSDSHDPVRNPLGYPRNCMDFGFNEPQEVTDELLTTALLSLKNLITGGPFINVSIDGKGMGETVSAAGGNATLHVLVQAPSWMDVNKMRIFVSGVEMQTITLDETTADPLNPVVRFNGDLNISTGGTDGWVIVVVQGDTTMEPAYPGQRPFAATNPIFIDAI